MASNQHFPQTPGWPTTPPRWLGHWADLDPQDVTFRTDTRTVLGEMRWLVILTSTHVSFKGFLPGSYSNIIIIMRAAGNLRDCPFLEHQTRIVRFHPSFTLNNWLHWGGSGWMSLVLPGERETAFASSHLSEWDWVLLLCCLTPTISETQLCWYTKSMRRQSWDLLCTGDAPWLQDTYLACTRT